MRNTWRSVLIQNQVHSDMKMLELFLPYRKTHKKERKRLGGY